MANAERIRGLFLEWENDMSEIALSAPIRANLISLTNTTGLINKTQNRLATGLKVSSALDDASAFFKASSLNNRASDLATLKDNIDQGISTIGAAIDGIESITDLVEQAKGLATKAKSSGDTTERSSLAAQFDDILTQINDLARDSSYNGVNLIDGGSDTLTVDFNEGSTSRLTISHLKSNASVGGLSIGAAANNFASDGDVDTALTAVNAALTELRTNASTLGSNNTVLQTRLEFTSKLINTLEGGAGKLTIADLNEESANLLALQTRQQLSTNALSLSAQTERSVLGLLG
ncbi:MAG: flagellin [Alphaproteobacteria bacterium]